MEGFRQSWEQAKELHKQQNSLDGLVVVLDLGDWASRVAMRGFAFALIAMGEDALAQEILRMIGVTE